MDTLNLAPAAVSAEIRQFVIANFLFGQSADSLRDDDSFLEGGVIDSTGVLELVAFLATQFDPVNKVADFVRRKLQP